ncbi:MAG: reverse transcriptase domain-containing protein, partial [Anaplasma sp.]|nr:reverse transcriptase domain-containing protein [Anaplasma sp.]
MSSGLSDPFLATSGVPQGSNLGPLLFLIFVNDLTLYVKYSKMLLFADDLKLYRLTNTVEDCVLLQSDVCSISLWCLTNGLVLNESKTQVISLSRKREVLQFRYALDSTVITRVSLIRDLGVYLDTELSFNQHVTNIVNSSLSVFGVITRISSNFKDPLCFLLLFRSLVRSRLEFSSVIWNSIEETNSSNIERVQRKFIHVFYDRYLQSKMFYEYERICKLLGLHTLCNRRMIRDFMF